jgi:hypothetical protein
MAESGSPNQGQKAQIPTIKSLYFAYGISIANLLLIITNAVSVAATTTTLSVAFTFRNRLNTAG